MKVETMAGMMRAAVVLSTIFNAIIMCFSPVWSVVKRNVEQLFVASLRCPPRGRVEQRHPEDGLPEPIAELDSVHAPWRPGPATCGVHSE